ncbi:chemotaxis protein CheY [Ectothiorhodospira haloalkaliphila]|uniref:Phosphate regulon transcriptional regulatory protein PhoB n=1 Tax=Ectothiorhodospira haloalkaliphila TaxID=421628 RepID=W8KL02_9GAMM|nr:MULTISPECIES: phosphate regulon transcriptional regulator PhoB [Ectothiorhodospira]AHK79853.1 chemotaxis protein CheY [Ectothiorhodospira haloalkaliphila]MCG5494162.1 phosphate regulon transcriptional regulator PhoB [Ectothiorhodospira variabilis]MCG5497393.1 phosphate regulon transcriptional regulator PhoB [Ectothiorhodospira variabilis]MCG5503308.1 phosphate regulon transcriptional regulator PhoB [Ectothiorhodospira variabilis]MCG5506604.1 phosphate regulon transcriptional regulator PhoB 
MNEKTILVVEDEPAIREMVGFALTRAGFQMDEAGDAHEAHARLADRVPDLIVVDWMLPGVSGIELARRLKREDYTREVPIIMLTARGEEDDKVGALDAGIDDYITKPFSPRELVARIKAVLRRSLPEEQAKPLSVDGLTLDPASHRVMANDKPLEIGPTEFRLLHFFMTHPERVYSRSQLLDRVWGRNTYVEERTVDVHILRLRKALSPHGCDRYVQTVRGAGYRFSQQG